MCESVYQKRGACWNQSAGWEGVFADWRTRPFHQRRGGGLRCQGCNNQRNANHARRVRATSSQRNSQVVISLEFQPASVGNSLSLIERVGPSLVSQGLTHVEGFFERL